MKALSEQLYDEVPSQREFADLAPSCLLADMVGFDSLSMFRAVVAIEMLSGALLFIDEVEIPETTQDLYGLYLHAEGQQGD